MSNVVNYHCPNVPAQDDLQAQVMVALTQDDRGMHAAYIGIVRPIRAEAQRLAAAQWVADRGRKLRYSQALEHFPGLSEKQYRA